MNDQENPEPDFDDPAYDDLRALLADARVTAPVPADVAARLEETLAGLTADRRDAVPDLAESPAVVVPLHRRRRVGARLLAAAAAVVVVGAGGVGISQVLDTENAADMATAESAPEPAVGDEFGPVAPQSAESGGPQHETLDPLSDDLARHGVVLQFTSAGFADEAAAFQLPPLFQDDLDASPTPKAAAGETPRDDAFASDGATPTPQWRSTAGGTSTESSKVPADSRYFAAKAACPGPVGIAATLVPIQLDGRPAALALYASTTEGQRFEAWSCDGSTLLASTVVPR